ncbi:hypothetical protein [Streptomyces fungicidicus]|uniref:hypothetical protein n=1 Tax=Streptomyces fungicidicus TaxID=68203 RepID=UPI00365B1D87
MSDADAALWWARVRAQGPLRMPAATRTPAGMLRMVEQGGEHCWLLPRPPDDVTPAVLRELRMSALPVEFPNETNRVLAAVLRCCWADVQASPWPGQSATMHEVLDVVDQLIPGREKEVLHRFGMGAFRRLQSSRWLDIDDEAQTVRLGPRAATWPDQDLPVLRDLWRELPPPRPDGKSER